MHTGRPEETQKPELSSSIGFSTLTPGDTGVEETDLDRLLNQLRFLQTVDLDNDTSNGIRLPVISGAFTINFAQRIEDFESDLEAQAFLTAHAGGRPLVAVQDAVAHFSQSINTVSIDNVVSFAGRTATSAITNTACINNIQAQQRYACGPTSVTLSGSDGFDNNGGDCTVKPDANEVIAYADIGAGDFLSCLPGSAYIAHETRRIARSLGLTPANTPVCSPQSNGMAESFVNTFKRDYVSRMDLCDARTVPAQLPAAFEHFNEVHPHSSLKMKSPREFRRQRVEQSRRAQPDQPALHCV